MDDLPVDLSDLMKDDPDNATIFSESSIDIVYTKKKNTLIPISILKMIKILNKQLKLLTYLLNNLNKLLLIQILYLALIMSL